MHFYIRWQENGLDAQEKVLDDWVYICTYIYTYIHIYEIVKITRERFIPTTTDSRVI